jgi:hypothetical protein
MMTGSKLANRLKPVSTANEDVLSKMFIISSMTGTTSEYYLPSKVEKDRPLVATRLLA